MQRTIFLADRVVSGIDTGMIAMVSMAELESFVLVSKASPNKALHGTRRRFRFSSTNGGRARERRRSADTEGRWVA